MILPGEEGLFVRLVPRLVWSVLLMYDREDPEYRHKPKKLPKTKEEYERQKHKEEQRDYEEATKEED
jgi:hypothetical protein